MKEACRTWVAKEQAFMVNVTMKVMATTEAEARKKCKFGRVEHVLREDLRGRGELSFSEELDQRGGELIWDSPEAQVRTKKGTQHGVTKKDSAFTYKRLTLEEWKYNRALFEASEKGSLLLRRSVAQVWLINGCPLGEVWVKSVKHVRRG